MGTEYLLVRDDNRETYDLGKFTGDWVGPLGGNEDAPWNPFVIEQDVDLLAVALEICWDELGLKAPAGYLRLVAEDVVRWAGTAVVRFTHDGSFDGWRTPEGGHDEGNQTGSRYPKDHPEWQSEPAHVEATRS